MPDDPKPRPTPRRTRTSEEIGGIIGFLALLVGFIVFVFLLARGCVGQFTHA